MLSTPGDPQPRTVSRQEVAFPEAVFARGTAIDVNSASRQRT
ncbi:hypothetical protein [Streptomyces sp. NPDC006012]